MDQKYCIECRYQKWTRNGIEWTQWFLSYTDKATKDKNYLQERISEYIKRDKSVKGKLKHEYRIVEYVEPTPIVEMSAIQKKSKKSPRKTKNIKDK